MIWTLITYVYFVGIFEGRAVSVHSTQFNSQALCQEAGGQLSKLESAGYRIKFICVKAQEK